MKQENLNSSVNGDRALCKGGTDRLGFRDVAARIATSLVDHATDDGLVIGIDGTWGSGKSSLLYLIQEELEKLPESQRPTLINFRPWLVGNREALLTSLFLEFDKGINHYKLAQGDASGIKAAEAEEASEAIRKFSARLEGFGAVLEVAGEAVAGTAGGLPGRIIKHVGRAADKKEDEPPLVEQKEKITKILRSLGHRFIVTIDDVDRLDPAEVVEVLRLVRSVADFPNVIYLLCYDSEILKNSIEQASKVRDGKAFLEKIVQLTVMVPTPETFQLRTWFSEELSRLGHVMNEAERERVKSVIDLEGGKQLTTPRSVVRSLDSIRFFWPPLRAMGADLADLVWLMLIKDGNAKLYRWIENYCTTAASVSLGVASVDEHERKKILEELMLSIGNGYFGSPYYAHEFADKLLGVKPRYAKTGDPISIFLQVDSRELDVTIRGKRLKSPDHYRLYFALSGPSHALTQGDFDLFRNSATGGPSRLSALLLNWHGQTVAGDLTKTDLLFERLSAIAPELLSPEESKALLFALGDMLDDAYRKRPFDHFAFRSIWDRAEGLVSLLLSKVSKDERMSVLNQLFESAKAIGWLTSIFRHETFAQGRYGNQVKPEEKWLLSSIELDEIAKTMLKRYQEMPMAQVFASPSPLSLLFAWRQAGDKDGPKKLIASHIKDDASLINILEGLTSNINSSNRGLYEILKRDNLEPFLNYLEVREKIKSIASRPENSRLKEQAQILMSAFEDGDMHSER